MDLLKELLDDGWTVASFRRPIDTSKVKDRLQLYHAKGHVIRCHIDQERNMFRIAHREKDLRDYRDYLGQTPKR